MRAPRATAQSFAVRLGGRSVLVAAGVASGLVVAFSLPPFGVWILGPAGFAGLALLLGQSEIAGRPLRQAAIGAAFGLGQHAVGLWWVTGFHWAGYVVLVLLGMGFAALMGLLVPATRWGRMLGFPAAVVVAEALRSHVPFGGLPLGGVALGQAAGPLAPAGRLGGSVLIAGMAALAGSSLAAMLGTRQQDRKGARLGLVSAGAALVIVGGVALAGRLAPDGAGAGPHPVLRVATVQGGGRRGLRSIYVDPEVVFERQLAAARTLPLGLNLVLFPEDVVTVSGPVGQTPEGAAIADLARQLNTTIVAGVVEDVGTDRFRNAALVWSPAGEIVARYDKVHRVPFGEYVPGRAFFSHLADLSAIPRDALPGHGSGQLRTPAGTAGTVISYEVFFDGRARSAIRAGGQVLLVPTNAASFRTSQVPTQEVAAAQLRAWETGRDTVQAAPTGYSALIDHRGRVQARSVLGRQQTLVGTVSLRSGKTPYVRYGPGPVLVLAVALLAGLWVKRLVS